MIAVEDAVDHTLDFAVCEELLLGGGFGEGVVELEGLVVDLDVGVGEGEQGVGVVGLGREEWAQADGDADAGAGGFAI
jgi:hypothetical protein